MRLEDAILLGEGEARVERQDLGLGRMVLAQGFCGFTDLALAGKEDQDVPGAGRGDLVHRVEDALLHVAILHLFAAGAQRPVANLDRMRAPGDLDHRGSAEVIAEAPRIDGRGGDDDLEIWTPPPQSRHVPEQEVDVQAALVRFVDDERVVAQEARVAPRRGEQDAVRHDLDEAVGPRSVAETHLVADRLPQRRPKLIGDPSGDGSGGDAARLRMPDHARSPSAQLQADLGQLGGLPRAGLATDDDDGVRLDRPCDLRPSLDHRQIAQERGAGTAGRACLAAPDGGVDVMFETLPVLTPPAPGDARSERSPESTVQPCLIAQHALVDPIGEAREVAFWFRHDLPPSSKMARTRISHEANGQRIGRECGRSSLDVSRSRYSRVPGERVSA